jgi:hypothetical protein
MSNLPSLESMFDNQFFRLEGINSWEDIKFIGKNNIDRLIQIAQEIILKFITQQVDKDEIRAMNKGIEFLTELSKGGFNKPYLPRIRNENINTGDKVIIFVADTKGNISKTDWIKGLVVDKQKSFKSEWVDGTPNSGYFWLLTAKLEAQVFPTEDTIKFSTSEPRVLHDREYHYLKDAVGKDPEFLEIFSNNANRRWLPIWCLEKGIISTNEMNMKSWIEKGTF